MQAVYAGYAPSHMKRHTNNSHMYIYFYLMAAGGAFLQALRISTHARFNIVAIFKWRNEESEGIVQAPFAGGASCVRNF